MAERFKPIDRDALDPEQQAVFDAILSGPRGSVPHIFQLYLASPELASHVQKLGAFCRYRTCLPRHLSELAILTVARHWSAEYEWVIHRTEAKKAGLPEDLIAAIEMGKRPDFNNADAELVYDFSAGFFRQKEVSDALFGRAIARFGRKTVVELAGLLGYYSMLAVAIRIFRLTPEE
jgi:4-carboxymuconolactone decarboxylase